MGTTLRLLQTTCERPLFFYTCYLRFCHLRCFYVSGREGWKCQKAKLWHA